MINKIYFITNKISYLPRFLKIHKLFQRKTFKLHLIFRSIIKTSLILWMDSLMVTNKVKSNNKPRKKNIKKIIQTNRGQTFRKKMMNVNLFISFQTVVYFQIALKEITVHSITSKWLVSLDQIVFDQSVSVIICHHDLN